MALLKGAFDPKKFNATELGRIMYSTTTEWSRPGVTWADLTADQTAFWVDYAQHILDQLAFEGIVR